MKKLCEVILSVFAPCTSTCSIKKTRLAVIMLLSRSYLRVFLLPILLLYILRRASCERCVALYVHTYLY